MMEIADIVRRLNQMRDAQVVLRQVAISKQERFSSARHS